MQTLVDLENGTAASFHCVQRQLARLTIEERYFKDLLKICDRQIETITEQRRGKFIWRWESKYQRLAEEIAAKKSCPEIRLEGEEGTTTASATNRIRRVDLQAYDMAVLASELSKILSKEEYENMRRTDIVENQDEEETSWKSAKESGQEKESQTTPYLQFLIVDENKRALGAEAETVGEKETWETVAEKETWQAASNNAYIDWSPSDVRSVKEAPRSPSGNSSRQSERAYVTIVGNGQNNLDDMRTAIGYDRRYEVLKMQKKNFDKTSSNSASSNATARVNVKRIPAYSMLNDQNQFILIPVINFVDEKRNFGQESDEGKMNAAQRLWQNELNSSSGQYIRYSIATDPFQSLADQEATTIAAADLPTEYLGTMVNPSEIKPKNMQRSLLHRVLAERGLSKIEIKDGSA